MELFHDILLRAKSLLSSLKPIQYSSSDVDSNEQATSVCCTQHVLSFQHCTQQFLWQITESFK